MTVRIVADDFLFFTMLKIRLVDQGHQVIGVEFVRKPIEDFFSENHIPFEKEVIKVKELQNCHVYTVSLR